MPLKSGAYFHGTTKTDRHDGTYSKLCPYPPSPNPPCPPFRLSFAKCRTLEFGTKNQIFGGQILLKQYAPEKKFLVAFARLRQPHSV